MKKGQMDIDTYNTKFRCLIPKAKLDPVKDQNLLVSIYEQSIDTDVALMITVQDTAKTLDQWMENAARIERVRNRNKNIRAKMQTKIKFKP